MSVSTPTLAPEPHPGSGTGANAETPDGTALELVQRELGAQTLHHTTGGGLTGQLVARARRSDFDSWLARMTSVGACTRPIRLTGRIQSVDPHTGEVVGSLDTREVSDGALYTACGDRRASVCPACAETYRRDAYQLVRAGLAGGKGMPESVATHPAVFATLTAPSFGPVHARRVRPDGRVHPCRPRRKPDTCPHGRDLRCNHTHRVDEKRLGRPLCPDCFDYAGAVVWNAHASELWRRTTMRLRRSLQRTARAHGGQVKVAFGKVAEFQTRGLVHFHALLRLDGHNPDYPEQILPPPASLTAGHLEDAVREAAASTAFATLPHPDNPDGWDIAWGHQVDVHTVATTGDGQIHESKVAGYLAKYATKSTEATGTVSARITEANLDIYADPRTHAGRLIRAAWNLGSNPDLPDDFAALRRWAHMLGFRGHFFTKSRRYSTTFGALRQARTDYRRRQAAIRARDHHQPEGETPLVVGALSYAAIGWRTTADALLAQTAAARAREKHHTVHEELACID